MEEKVLKIEIPEGYEIDKERSTFEKIVFKLKPKKESYLDISKELFYQKRAFYFSKFGGITSAVICDGAYCDPNNCTSEKQLRKLLAINQLMNTAKYLNGDWKPGQNYYKYTIVITRDNKVSIGATHLNNEIVYFKTEELAKKAIEILGEETIKLALSTDW